MKKYLKALLATALVACNILAVTPILNSNLVYAASATDDAKKAACEGIALTGGDCAGAGNNTPGKTINNTVNLAINIFSWIVGIAAVIMIIFAGLLFVTAAGDSGKVGKAKDAILYAIVGLVVVAIAQAIVQFVLGNAVQ